MITYNNNIFHLKTKSTSYVFYINKTNHLIFEYYGKRLSHLDESIEALKEKWPFAYGSSINYDEEVDPAYSLDLVSLEVSTIGKGDYREPSLKIRAKHGYVFDFTYVKHEITKEALTLPGLPLPRDASERLTITLYDEFAKVTLKLNYLVYENSDVIGRNLEFINEGQESVYLEKIMSMQLDLINDDYSLLNLYGGWISEGQKAITKLKPGIFINDSKTGASSNRHNPFFMLLAKKTTLHHGNAYAFNFIYSGNHYEMIEVTNYDKVRLQIGLNPYAFDYEVKAKETFITPLAVMSFSSKGINGASQNMHHFVNYHMIKKQFENYLRPVLINNWEATYFKFNEIKLLSLARKAKSLGIELFVLDDGWFKNRDDDTKALGDYEINKKKLPFGLDHLVKKINKLGLKFGLWFEPEMVSENSDLFRAHPDWIIGDLNRPLCKGRHQLVFDLSKKEVRDYLVENLDNVLKSANIEYVKWDCNRHISDFYSTSTRAGELLHKQVLGLYDVLERITSLHPNILFEGCSSGGNRFDLGMLYYMPQTWASDNTDGHQRLSIQSGYALAYPLSSIGAHVSASPSHQLLRKTPIDTRFNIACFGLLGYELDLTNLDNVETKAVKAQVAYYKLHRKLLQYGTFYQLAMVEEDGYTSWLVLSNDKKEAIIGYYNKLQVPNPKTTILKGVDFLDDELYLMEVRPQEHNIKLFGGLINMISPVRLNEDGFLVNRISHFKTMPGEKESYLLSGSLVNNGGIKLNPEWAGVGYSDGVRILADFGSRLYHFRVKNKEK